MVPAARATIGEGANPLQNIIGKASLLLVLLAAEAGAQTASNWTQKSPQSNPGNQSGHVMAYDSTRGQVVLFAASGLYGTSANTTWVWDGVNWTQKSPQTSPPGRSAAAMAYDSFRRQVVMFGGISGDGTNAETWVWDGGNWTQKFPQTVPPVRSEHAMAYDSANHQIVMFGGYDAFGNFLGDTWSWDGTDWTQRLSGTGPGARSRHNMTDDSAHRQVVLFGGIAYSGNGVPSAETWVWDGSVSSWTLKTPPASPPGREFFPMAYDSDHRQVVLFGGFRSLSDVSAKGNDTWVWDGTTWTQALPQTSPPARVGARMVYDSARGQIVLYGGNGNVAVGNQTWTWGAPSVAPPPTGPTIDSVISAGAFGGFPAAAPGSWVEIYGTNLSSTTRQWKDTDFSGNSAPTSLDGVQVTVGGQKGFIDYVASSPGQVNVQLPSNIGPGTLQLTVTNGNLTSAPINLTVNATEPGLLAPASFKIGASQYVVAQLGDGNYVLPAGAIAGVNSRPAKPGETIVIYGIGFGPVTPNTPAGQIVTQGGQLSGLRILFGQTPAQVPYAGLSPGYLGLYQFNIVVPAVADSNLVPLTFSLDGAAGVQTLYTAVHQ